MATSRSSSAAARLSRSAANAFRSSGQSMHNDLASAMVRPRALIALNESKISIPSSLSTASHPAPPSLDLTPPLPPPARSQEPRSLKEWKARPNGLPWL